MRGEIRALTGLRGVAATAVMIDHYMAVDFSGHLPWTLLPHFYVAVDLFMLLSGFVLARSQEARLRVQPVGQATLRFFQQRVARLYPMYAVMTLVCFVLCRLGWLTFLHPDTSAAALAANLATVQTWAWPGTSLDGPGWSISAEVAANLLMPLIMPLVLAPSGRPAAVAAIVAVLVLLGSALAFGSLFDVPAAGVVNIISGPQALGRCVSEFVLGTVLWRVRSRTRWGEVLATGPAQAALLAGMLLLLLWPALDVPFVLLSAALVLGLSFDRSALCRALGQGAPHRLGLLSYSIYLVHIALLPVRDWLAGVLDRAETPHGWVLAVFCTATLTVGVSALTFRWLEQPARRWIAALHVRERVAN